MIVEFDKEADALYIQLREQPVAFTRNLGDGRVADFAEDGSVVGIEFLAVSEGVDPSEVPDEHEVRRALEGQDVRVLA